MLNCSECNQKNTSIISKFKGFNFSYYDEFQYFCFKNCILQYLQLIGAENPILYVNVGFELVIEKINGKYSILKYFNANPLLKMELLEFGYSLDFKETLTKNLEDVPLIVIVDVYYLPYRKEYLKHHGSHAIFLIGFNGNAVYVMDWYAPHFFKGYVELDDFIKARSSNYTGNRNPFSDKEIQNFWYKPTDIILDINIKENIINNFENIFNSQLSESSYSGKNAFYVLIEHIKDYLVADTNFLKNFCRNLHNEIFLYTRSAALAKLYFSKVYEVYKGALSLKLLDYIDECVLLLKKINFNLLKGSVLNPIQNLELVVNDLNLIKTIIDQISLLHIEI